MRHTSRLLIAICLFAAPLVSRADISDQDFDKAIEKYLGTDKGQASLGGAVEKYFQKKQQEVRKKQEEQAGAEMENQFKNPVQIPAGSSPSKGEANAKVTIIEFSDFQCPYCQRGMQTMQAVMKKYPKDVKLVFKNLPLPFHENALPSAKAALAAGKQGKFWEMHDAFFANQSKLSPEFYEEQAKTLGLNLEKFKKDMESEEIAKQIKDDQELAQKNQISGTPGFFVNGVAVRGAYPEDHFSKIIDRWLAGKAGSNG